MLLPRMLISFASWGMVVVGNETLMISPPVKNGFTSWRSGDIMAIRHESRQSGGTVTRSCASRYSIASSARSRIRAGCLPGSTYMCLDVLEGRLPVVAVAHLARGFLHLVLAPCQLGLRELDQFFGRVRDHLVFELAESRASRPIGLPTISLPRSRLGLAPASRRGLRAGARRFAAGRRLPHAASAAGLRRPTCGHHRRRRPGPKPSPRPVVTAPSRCRRKSA